MSLAIEQINHIRQLCPLQVKVMSEGEEVNNCLSDRFAGDFEFVDGMQSNTPYDLMTFACTTVLIGGFSSFSVLGALLMDGMVIAPPDAMRKYNTLRNVVALPPAHANDLALGVRELAPCSQTPPTSASERSSSMAKEDQDLHSLAHSPKSGVVGIFITLNLNPLLTSRSLNGL